MAGATLTEKILSLHANRKQLTPGETIWVDADVLMTHDVCGPGTISIFKREFGKDARVWDRERVVIIPDHFIFTEDADSQRNVEILRAFVKEQDLPYFYDPGTERYRGVCHVTLAEEGHIRPGELIFGTDSHTCSAGAFGAFATGIGNTDAAFVMGTGKLWVKVPPTIRVIYEGSMPDYLTAKDLILKLIGQIGVDGASYAALEFAGQSVESMEMEERLTLCNMAIESGAKNGIVAPDGVTRDYLSEKTDEVYAEFKSDADASFLKEYRLDVEGMEPVVAKPHSPDRVVGVSELRGAEIDCCYIGSCTGGKIADFRRAAEILAGRTVRVETFCVPATVAVERQLDEVRVKGQSIREILAGAGAKLTKPSCAACLGGPKDTFGRLKGSERCISTTNRNFPGRMGSPDAQVYLASPYTVAAAAVAGHIADPREYLSGGVS